MFTYKLYNPTISILKSYLTGYPPIADQLGKAAEAVEPDDNQWKDHKLPHHTNAHWHWKVAAASVDRVLILAIACSQAKESQCKQPRYCWQIHWTLHHCGTPARILP